MTQGAKKEVFGHFLELGSLDRLHIAYCDIAKQSSRFGDVVTQVFHVDHSIITSRWYQMTCFDPFLAIFLSFVHWIDFILHILIVLNGLYDLVMVSLMLSIINYA